MGWQSYILPISDEKNRELILEAILEVIRKHNDPKTEDTGEALFQIEECKIRNQGQPLRIVNAILCGNGGGRTYTFDFFQNHDVVVWPYNSDWTIVERKEIHL